MPNTFDAVPEGAHERSTAFLAVEAPQDRREQVMDEAGLRAVFRARSREVHPDLNPTAVVDGEEGSGGGVPTVYEVNLAYEAVRKML